MEYVATGDNRGVAVLCKFITEEQATEQPLPFGAYSPQELDVFLGGWLGPDGCYWPADELNHQLMVDHIVEALGLKPKGDPMAWLEDHGWLRLWLHGAIGGWNYGRGKVTQAQLDTLWELAERFAHHKEQWNYAIRAWEAGGDDV